MLPYTMLDYASTVQTTHFCTAEGRRFLMNNLAGSSKRSRFSQLESRAKNDYCDLLR